MLRDAYEEQEEEEKGEEEERWMRIACTDDCDYFEDGLMVPTILIIFRGGGKCVLYQP